MTKLKNNSDISQKINPLFLDKPSPDPIMGSPHSIFTMKIINKITGFLVSSLIVALALPELSAQTVAWGGSASVSPLSFDSHGNQDVENHVWELGWFSDGFTPTGANATSWAANWNSVDVGAFKYYPDPEDPVNGLNLYAANEIVYNPGAVGKVMYTFVHNGGSSDPSIWGGLMGTPQGEALIYTRGLTFLPVPAPTVSFNIANNPLDAADDNDFVVIWGRVDRNMYLDSLWGGVNTPASPAPANGGVIQGGGVISNPIADSQAGTAGDFNTYDALNGVFGDNRDLNG